MATSLLTDPFLFIPTESESYRPAKAIYDLSRKVPDNGGTIQLAVWTYMAFFANSLLWSTYGFLLSDSFVFLQNFVSLGLAVYSLYIVYFMMNRTTPKIEIQPLGSDTFVWPVVGGWTFIVLVLFLMVKKYMIDIDTFGLVALIAAIVQFGSPLAVVKTVLFQGYTGGLLDSQLSMLLTATGFTWTIYGCIVNNKMITIPNFLGTLLAALQLFVGFITPPTKNAWTGPGASMDELEDDLPATSDFGV